MSNLATRIAAACVLIPFLLLTVLYAPKWLFFSINAVVAALCAWEYGSITLGNRFPFHRFLLAIFSAFICLSFCFSTTFSYFPILALFSLPVLTFFSFMFSSKEFSESAPASSIFSSGALYTGSLTGLFSLIVFSSDSGRQLMLLLAAATFLGDTMAYAFGRVLGGPKLAPRISPGKTWSGSFGGLVGVILGVVASKYLFLPDLSWLEVALLSPVLSAFCQSGDLAESFLKRGFDVKDSGKLIPGHGGILDRIDGLMFGAPIVYLFSLIKYG